jgi:PAS domain S-box-containing protein
MVRRLAMPPVPRQVRNIYAVRVVAFVLCFVTVGLHALDRGFGWIVWLVAALHFLVYPHFAMLRSALARDPLRAEMQHLYLDAFLFGAWIPVLEFPLWIAFPMIASPALNGVVNRGMAGLGLSLISSSFGILAGLALHGFVYWPATSPLVTTLAFLGSLAYGASVGHVLYRQTQRLAEARERVRESERRYRLIAEHAGDLVAMVDRDGRWLYASPSYARLLRAEDLAAGRDAFACVHEEDQFRVRGAVQVVLRSGESCRLRLRLHTASGDVRRLEAMVHPVREAGETERTITGAVMASRDVTELRDREEQLEVAAHAFERMAEGMVITNAAGRILTVNHAFSRITGHGPEEVLGRHESEFRAAMQPQSFYDDLYAQVLRSGRWDGTTWCRRRDGTVYREWRSVSAVRDAGERITHYVSLFRELDRRGAGDEGLPERPAKSA